LPNKIEKYVLKLNYYVPDTTGWDMGIFSSMQLKDNYLPIPYLIIIVYETVN
jgi:hypothetical protein